METNYRSARRCNTGHTTPLEFIATRNIEFNDTIPSLTDDGCEDASSCERCVDPVEPDESEFVEQFDRLRSKDLMPSCCSMYCLRCLFHGPPCKLWIKHKTTWDNAITILPLVVP